MLGSLIEKLEKIEYKLIKTKTEGSLVRFSLPPERCRSLSNMVNVLGSLVNKTIQGKNYEDDIALFHRESNKADNEPQFPNLINSEEFFMETKKLLKFTPSLEALNVYLTNFHELLGDILFSICQISNYEMKLASGIQVKDLVNMKNCYFSIWELISSMFFPNSFNVSNSTRLQRNRSVENSIELNQNIADILSAVQPCLKEMSKIKVDIEHYLKFNLIELQFAETSDKNKVENNVPVASEASGVKNKKGNYFGKNGKNVCMNKKTNILINNHSFPKGIPEQNKTPSTLFNISSKQTDFEENYMGSYIFPPNLGNCDNYCDCKVIEESYGNYFNPQIIYPPEILFFEPPTVVIQSKVEPTPKHSMPRIYSVESVNQDSKCYDVKNNPDEIRNIQSNTVTVLYNKEENIEEPQSKDTEEDLFSENTNKKISETEFVHLKKKISSLFNLLRTNPISDNEDIFDTSPLQIQSSELSCSKQKTLNKPETRVKKKNNLQEDHTNHNKTRHLHYENKGKQRSNIQRNKIKKSTIRDILNEERYENAQKHHLNVGYPILSLPDHTEVIYDEKSVIQLFKTDTRNCSNSGSFPAEESRFCMWPVTAEYIYVKRGQGEEKCRSVSSDNSISLAKGFEKSFFSLHLNKKYEQNQQYDGDLIVLDHTERHPNKESSNYSLFNQSSISYDKMNRAFDKNSDIEHLYSNNYGEKPNNRNTEMISFNNRGMPMGKKDLHAQQSYAVQYADCGDSFIVNRNFKGEKLDFLNFNGYNGSQNWDSFISIVTSKVGPTTHINQRRMFRKIVQNLGAESFHDNNIFTNAQQLTSNSGPFRLFDINGYPLTDSAGNVLKDPYGKSVVELDSTGFPKDNVKVFDAAGNSPKDVNFDPTQKPKTNCVVVKLTDNFRRQLHLFDKYGRPLTDSNGKLLVNIHGRPLLRFDNFGRPNTDYRGGPLYTDNGLRWSYKTGQSISTEQLSQETLTARKVNDNLENDSVENSSGSVIDDKQENNHTYLKTRNSDIWLQVENVLQLLPNKKNIIKKTEQNNLIVSNASIEPKPIEKECLSSIIYHDRDTKEYTDHSNTNYTKKETNYEEMSHPTEVDTRIFLEKQQRYVAKQDFLERNLNETIHFPFYNDELIKNACSKCFANTKISNKQPDIIMSRFILGKNTCKVSPLSNQKDAVSKSDFVNTSTCHPTSVTNNIPSIFTFKNHEYLNNLCNQILKNQLESKAKLKNINNNTSTINPEFENKKGHFAETSVSEFTSSIMSKYTTDIPLYNSPTASIGLPSKNSQIIKILEDIDSKFKKHDRVHLLSNSKFLRDQDVTLKRKEIFSNENIKKDSKTEDQKFKEYHEKSFQPTATTEDITTDTDIINKGNTQYPVNDKERIRAGLQKREFVSCGADDFVSTESNCITEYFPPEQEKKAIQNISNQKNPLPYLYHGEYCRHFKNDKNKSKDSPFRFPSDDQMETTVAMNDDIDYVREQYWQAKTKTPKKYTTFPNVENKTFNEYLNQNKNHYQQFFERGNKKGCEFDHRHAGAKQQHFHQKGVKKTAVNRDCNLVSFLGTPVKYVLNKLDNKLSQRQQEKNKKQMITQTERQPKLKTIYDTSKLHKKDITSSENEKTNINSKKRHKHYFKQKGNLLAFRSKSYSDVPQHSKIVNMSYSGSQDTNTSKYYEYSPDSSSQYHKCSSDTVIMTNDREKYPLHRGQKFETNKLKKVQYSFESDNVKRKHMNHHHQSHRHNSNKSPKRKRYDSISPNSTTKHMKLFRKSKSSAKKKVIR